MSSIDTDVIIVGGGPSGLVLGLFLAEYEIKSIILEKDEEITQDPRGAVLTGPAVRSLWKLGLGEYVHSIGLELKSINFHDTSFQNDPFLSFSLEEDSLQHVVPSAIVMNQPKLEFYLRKLLENSKLCTLHRSCDVVAREETTDNVSVQYVDRNGAKQEVRGLWLVGADGKRGVVRKKFLEPSAGVRQEVGIFEYDGIWIAGNLKITLPTPQSHPDLPFWENGLDPEAVFDLFWPPGWHFCRPPGRPVAAGRIGSSSEHLFRHELAVPDWDDSMDADAIFWENLTPMITRTVMTKSNIPIKVVFPRECIEVLRCRPFRFDHRVVNKWFHNRTILIGDAAHVFPPFGGQGVVSGVQDAENLAWRLAALVKMNGSPTFQKELLQSWASERRLGIDNSARLTFFNGKLCNDQPTFVGKIFNQMMGLALSLSSILGQPSPEAGPIAKGYQACQDGTFLAQFDGGAKLAQIYLQIITSNSQTAKIELSDAFLRSVPTIFTLVVIQSPAPPGDALAKELEDLGNLFNESGISKDVLSKKSIVYFDPSASSNLSHYKGEVPLSFPASRKFLISYPSRLSYDPNQFMRRLGNSQTKYVIIRPDQIIYAKAKTLQDLTKCLESLKGHI
ncbi:monooxygenase, putative [Talaromyces stipitatus ATCC 10500]|uniref:Monooxygenase, putative n=1 Tax=Talaromyces stipitatus (strain ATCC 10500 / CBS 375.48 / QM 6759 / NRRL 1006) TaxID=441959 RepID=B8MRV2_TALSN|nr:monooxygenase, putative [Talaromyces stipitatus ATCC 10500]EED13286.1 monooxygenase, putative [Talaromyces stipitatus ATCC 10500]